MQCIPKDPSTCLAQLFNCVKSTLAHKLFDNNIFSLSQCICYTSAPPSVHPLTKEKHSLTDYHPKRK